MPDRVLLLHWNATEGAGHAERLRVQGFAAECFTGSPGDGGYRRIVEDPPDAIVIDLTRRPSHGRELGIYLRGQKATRGCALVFIEGDPEKTAQIRGLLPDAEFTTWNRIAAAVRRALKNRPQNPVVPGTFAAYAGTPLPRKLRILEGSTVTLLHPPDGFETKLSPLPQGVRFEKNPARADVILAFLKSEAILKRELAGLAPNLREGRTLWLIWPKKTSGVATDLTQARVRELGLAAGIVDYKICALDETWSGLAFAARKAKPAKAR